jgi:hypothetical protein
MLLLSKEGSRNIVEEAFTIAPPRGLLFLYLLQLSHPTKPGVLEIRGHFGIEVRPGFAFAAARWTIHSRYWKVEAQEQICSRRISVFIGD